MSENKTSPIRAYIENAHDESIGGFTIPLPVSGEALRPWLEAISADGFNKADIAIREVRSSIPGLEETLQGFEEEEPAFDELNYLAVKISGLNDRQMDIFTAVLEDGRYSGSVRSLINLTKNINNFDLAPAFSEEQYGEFLIQTEKDNTADAFEKLEQSENPDERAFAKYILRLEAYVDPEVYGRAMMREESGAFTEQGYLSEHGEFIVEYHGQEDIPIGYRIFTAPQPPMMMTDVDVPAFLVELHAVAGDYSRDAEHSIGMLSKLRSTEYLLLMDKSGAFMTEAAHAYRHGTSAFIKWINVPEKSEAQAFSIHLTQVHGRIAGDVVQVDILERQNDILQHSIHPVEIDAILQDGKTRIYSSQEWDALSMIEKDGMRDWRRVFEDGDYSKVHRHLEELHGKDESFEDVPMQKFLTGVNALYMEQARHPAPDMLRISQTAAKEMLARGDCEVYRMLPEDVEKLSATDAVKSGLWYSEYREFAIKREDVAGLQKWADRSAADILNRMKGRDEQNKTKGPEL